MFNVNLPIEVVVQNDCVTELQRARARQLVRTNPYASNAAASFTAHAVGCGIKPSSLVEDADLKDRIQRLAADPGAVPKLFKLALENRTGLALAAGADDTEATSRASTPTSRPAR